MDASESKVAAQVSKPLTDGYSVLGAAMRSLSSEGVLAIQVGRAPTIVDPKPDIGPNANRELLFQILERIPEVEAMLVYEDSHCGFTEPRAFLVVCRSVTCRNRWYATADVVDYEIHERSVQTHSKQRALMYFDGVTHYGYQVAPRAWETIYCRREPIPFECAYRFMDSRKAVFEYNFENEAEGAFTITGDWDDAHQKIVKTHVFANLDIPEGSYIMPEHLASSLVLSNQTFSSLQEGLERDEVEDLVKFIEKFGHESKSVGSGKTLVEIGASFLIDRVDDIEKANVGRWIPPHPSGSRPKYSPVYERHRHSFDVFLVASKDIPKGGELLKHIALWEME